MPSACPPVDTADAPITPAPPPRPYVGRFAPSPTGPLHFGSLVAAVGSYLDARSQGGRWLLRIEDVDAPRIVPGAAEGIVRTLEAFGFAWDGEVRWQSAPSQVAAYQAALDALIATGRAYPCRCTRRAIAAAAQHTSVDGAPVYPGTCRHAPPPPDPAAWRFRLPASGAPADTVTVLDRLQGAITQRLSRDVGDFVLKRADGVYTYQLAVVVDDANQGVTDVVRGADLIDSTPRQVALQRALGLPTPAYLHLPVAANAAGEKLSKQTLAPALAIDQRCRELVRALAFLGQQPPAELAEARLDELWQWARRHWSVARVPARRHLVLTEELTGTDPNPAPEANLHNIPAERRAE